MDLRNLLMYFPPYSCPANNGGDDCQPVSPVADNANGTDFSPHLEAGGKPSSGLPGSPDDICNALSSRLREN